jgi:hypothetical protein
MIDNQFCGSPRMFFNNICVSLRQLSNLLGRFYESPRRFGMKHTSTPKLEIAAKNRRSFIKILKPQAVHIKALTHPYRPKSRPKNLMRQSLFHVLHISVLIGA